MPVDEIFPHSRDNVRKILDRGECTERTVPEGSRGGALFGAGSRPPAVIAVLLVCLVWSYWPTLRELRAFWAANDDYSVGQLVPFIALFLCWRSRRNYIASQVRVCWWGAVVILAAQSCRFYGVYYDYGSVERYSLILSIGGLVLLVGGWATFLQLKWILAFLLLMVPLPQRVHEFVSLPLQEASTRMAAYTLEVFGVFVARDGNVLRFDHGVAVAVTEACNGLRMLTATVLVAAVLVFLLRRPAWQNTALLCSSIAVAILINAVRLVVTSVVVSEWRDPSAVAAFHDYAGWAMMPLAVLLLLAELRLMSSLSRVGPTRLMNHTAHRPDAILT